MHDHPTVCVSNDGLQLTKQERQLIANFRAIDSCAKAMTVDLTAHLKRSMPAEPARLALVRSGPVHAHR